MPLVNIMVNQRAYTVACDEGEEEHLRELAKHVDSKVRELLGTVGHVGETRLLLMASLLITDDYLDAVAQREARTRLINDMGAARDAAEARAASAEEAAAAVLERTLNRVSDIAARLAEA